MTNDNNPIICDLFYPVASILGILFVVLLLAPGCALPPKPPPEIKKSALIRVSPSAYPEFMDDITFDGLAHSLTQSISYLKRISPKKTFRFENDVYDAVHMTRSLEIFLKYLKERPSNQDLNRFVKNHYLVYRSTGNKEHGEMLFTGYYEPLLQGYREKTGEYRHPIYSRPKDLLTIDLSSFSSRFKGERIIGKYEGQKVVPYDDRKNIDQDASFDTRSVPLAWVKDPVDLFFLHIQGSGKVFLENGDMINVHYHTTNGRPYRSIGRLLIEKGKIPKAQVSMQSIRAYLHDHPDEMEEILHYNPSYVFFKIEKEGPLGVLGVKLSPGRSIALDTRLFPLAGLAFIQSKKPLIDGSGMIHEWIDMNRFVLNQDTGGAIKGAGRADLFWGSGKNAEIAAGHMKHRGKLYFLVLKPKDD
jgi:membrane-bound lytic murein transglycosylase A